MTDALPTVDVGGPQYSPDIPRGQQGSEFDVRERVRTRLRGMGYPAPAVEGILQNLDRESGFNPEAVGDGGTSLGLMQAHKSRKDDLLNFAQEQKKPVGDVDLQVDFIDHELKTKFPELRQSLMGVKDAGTAEEQFKRIYERPASVMWGYGASGEPILGNANFRFSKDSLKNLDDVMMMPPQDYLDLSEAMGEPNARKRRSLAQSLAAGEPIEDLPSLDVSHEAGSPTGTVVGQDGRHRALAAQEAGLSAIPVQVNGAQPGMTELTGQQGKTLPVNYHKPTSFMDLLIPRAEAAQPLDQFKAWGAKQEAPTQAASPLDAFKAWGARESAQAPPPPTYMGEAGAQAETAEIERGIAEPMLGAVELAGKGLEKIGIPTGMADWANRQVQNVEQATQPAIAAAPYSAVLGGAELAIPEMLAGGAAGRALFGVPRAVQAAPGVINALQSIGMGGLRAIPGGVAASLTKPATDMENYWSEKLQDGLTFGTLAGVIGTAASGIGRAVGEFAQHVADRKERQAIASQVTQVLRNDLEPLWRKVVNTSVTRQQVRNLNPFVQTPIGQRGIKDEIKKASNTSVQGFNPDAYGLAKDSEGRWIIDPAVTGTGTDEQRNASGQWVTVSKGNPSKAPAVRFLDAVRREYDKEITRVRNIAASDPGALPLLDDLVRQRDAYVARMSNVLPSYRGMLERLEAGTGLLQALAETPSQVHELLRTAWSGIRGLGNMMFHNAPHAAANLLQAADAARNLRVGRANQLRAFAEARRVLPSMPPAMPERLNRLSQAGQAAGMGISVAIPGL